MGYNYVRCAEKVSTSSYEGVEEGRRKFGFFVFYASDILTHFFKSLTFYDARNSIVR